MDESSIEALITPKTKAIVPVHYAGVACDMDIIMDLAAKHNLFVVEDAAQAVDAYFTGKDGVKKPLGSIGHLAAFSFHETKNIMSGEGGLLAINDERFINRAEIIREKGTNRSAFFRGEVDKYNWVDLGSSFLPSDIIAAFLFAQLENLNEIQSRRKEVWNRYKENLKSIEEEGKLKLPALPNFASNNAHMFYILLPDLATRTSLITYLKDKGILSVFHYLSLHKSAFYETKHDGRILPKSDYYTDTLLRLPLFFELTNEQIDMISNEIKSFFNQN
jgi:dTDP-4-amino-4,6-dideoxygalactose transaminase